MQKPQKGKGWSWECANFLSGFGGEGGDGLWLDPRSGRDSSSTIIATEVQTLCNTCATVYNYLGLSILYTYFVLEFFNVWAGREEWDLLFTLVSTSSFGTHTYSGSTSATCAMAMADEVLHDHFVSQTMTNFALMWVNNNMLCYVVRITIALSVQ